MITFNSIPFFVDLSSFQTFIVVNFPTLVIGDEMTLLLYFIFNFFYILIWLKIIFGFLKYFVSMILRGVRF